MLGFDGMDPKILQGLMDAGRMPNFSRVAKQGTFKPLETSMPPQSPVAWSNFISGADPGTHEIYDFIHREANPPGRSPVRPYLSTSDTEPRPLPWLLGWLPDPFPWFGRFHVPLSGEQTRLLRRGPDFWTPLVEAGIVTAIYRMPATYPPPSIDGNVCLCAISGMGTPDIMGGYGEFTYFSEDNTPRDRMISGSRFAHLNVREHRAVAALHGPPNFLLDLAAYNRDLPNYKKADRLPPLRREFEIVRDPEAPVVKIRLADQVFVLNEGEWSEWVRFELETGVAAEWLLGLAVPTRLPVAVRFFVQQVHPRLKLYVSPMNIDPSDPVNAISTPPEFAAELAEACGPYYTQGIPEHTKILQTGALNEDEYLSHCRIVLDERIRQYRYAMKKFEKGFLFFYFGSTDQLAHIFWRDRDPDHPGRKETEAAKYGKVIDDCYVEMDGLVGEALDVLDADDTLIIMSDHGFTSFRRGFNVNTWLRAENYLVLKDGVEPKSASVPGIGVDWTRTRAYALGINSLYLNLRGREKNGIVPRAERKPLLKKIGEGLLAVRDPDNGERMIERVYYVDEYYPDADPDIAPDLLIGYAQNYRGSWGTTLGGIASVLVEDNLNRWSGDHCIAHHLVPGIVVTNRKITLSDPSLSDMAPTILDYFGIEPAAGMSGRPMLAAQR